jgi:hypothetical protein
VPQSLVRHALDTSINRGVDLDPSLQKVLDAKAWIGGCKLVEYVPDDR